MAEEEKERERLETHCCTPGAAFLNPADPLKSLINLTILLAATRHFSVLTFVVGSEERRRKNLHRRGGKGEKVRKGVRGERKGSRAYGRCKLMWSILYAHCRTRMCA